MNGKIFNSEGQYVADIRASRIYDLSGRKLYDLRGPKDLQANGRTRWSPQFGRWRQTAEKSTDRLFPNV